MMPNVAGEDSTRRQIFAYALLLAPVAVLPWPLGFASPLYGVAAGALGVAFVWRAWKVLAATNDKRPAIMLFAYSILYLFAIFAALLVDALATRLSAA